MIHAVIPVAMVIALLLLLAALIRRSSLSRLVMLPEELTLCRDADIAVSEYRNNRYYYYGRCMVLCTDRRVIVAQKIPLLNNSYLLRHLVDYRASEEEGIDLRATFLRGYWVARVAPSLVTVTREGARVSVRVILAGDISEPSRYLEYSSAMSGEYTRAFSNFK